jgi:signal transduction histidine kinase
MVPGPIAGKPDAPKLGFPVMNVKAKANSTLAREYREVQVFTGDAKGVVFVHRSSAAVRWAVALGAGLAGLLVVLAAAFAALRRWVARPLAELAGGADRIAGGDLTLAPVSTRAREIDQVATAMNGMATELESALAASDAAERERRFVVTAIAHDLRTPLFTLRGSLQAIERGIGNGEYVALAQRKADHLDRLVSDLFAFSRLEYAPAAGAADAVDVAALAREAADQYDGVAVSGGPAVVAGDAAGLLRVLTNLIDNAVRYAATAVHVDARAERDGVVVTVSDDGPGIPPELIDRVFEPLVTADGARRGGAGLGLAIVERIVSGHGGSVTAANDGGAVLTVRLPAPA